MKKEKKILVVDDEENIVNVVKAYLEKEGYETVVAYDGRSALDIVETERLDFIILDLMLPDVGGEEVCKKVRLKSSIPILMLTAKVEEGDRIMGLDLGADDYMTKPFSPKELVARVRAILRRIDQSLVMANIIDFRQGDLVIDLTKMEVRKRERSVDLTVTELKLLILLAQNPGKIFSREDLITKVLGYDYEGYDRTIDTHIKNIRHKIEDKENKYILTVYGIGYRFTEE